MIWHDADIARHALNFTLDHGGKLTYFEEALQLLESRGVTVVLRDIRDHLAVVLPR